MTVDENWLITRLLFSMIFKEIRNSGVLASPILAPGTDNLNPLYPTGESIPQYPTTLSNADGDY